MTTFTSLAENTRNSTLKALKAWLEVFFFRARKPPRAHTKHRQSLFHSALCYITHPPSSTSPCIVPLTIAVQWSEGMELAKHQPERWPGEKNYKKCVFVKAAYIVWIRWPLSQCHACLFGPWGPMSTFTWLTFFMALLMQIYFWE